MQGRAASARVVVGEGEPVAASLTGSTLTYGDRTVSFTAARDGRTLWLGRDGHAWALAEHVQAEGGAAAEASGDGVLRSPMPGTVLAVKVGEGDRVDEGQPIVVVEAMKMEHTVTAPRAGVVAQLPARAGAQVALDAVLAVIEEA